jgi:hypothetical protein
MDFDSSDNSNTKYSSKIKTQTLKQFQLGRLIKDGKVIPASKLAEASFFVSGILVIVASGIAMQFGAKPLPGSA